MSSPQNFYSFDAPSIDGSKTPLSQFLGKVALVVNTASECGYTPQYKGLQSIYNDYGKKGFVVLGFPSNDFGAQEPGSNAEIKKFCELKFHTTFPMFSKDVVKGPKKQPIYSYLTEKSPFQGEIKWNFEKFLIDKKGNVVARFGSDVEPTDKQITSKIEELLR